ncbi:TPA: SufD family Fe-S cluster assembly protein [Candidatus Ventrenecus avicola]|nr:SufD family Fe-S cluster assembly protein [Candidatus Ventrenecus avicola]
MNDTDKNLLKEISDSDIEQADAYNIRKNGKGVSRKTNPYINIVPKEDNQGIDVYVKENTLLSIIHVPVLLTESGLKDVVYNDFHIGKNSNVIILAGCGVHNDKHKDTEHDGIHRFFLEENAKVKYMEKHYGEGDGSGKNILNPVTEIFMKPGSNMTMDTTQIKGVDDTLRETKAILDENTTLVINEKILTNGSQQAKTVFHVSLNGDHASTHVTSRSVATENSYQEFVSDITGNSSCYAHVECDAILKENGHVKAIPEIYAKNPNANLIHEAAIGKIQGEQLMKLMSLGLNEKEAEDVIIKGFLK